MKIYLAGPINGCNDSEANDWRNEIKQKHPDVLNPMDRDYRGKEATNIENLVEQYKEDIDHADAVIVYYAKPSVGTSMEVLYAWENGTPVIIIDARKERNECSEETLLSPLLSPLSPLSPLSSLPPLSPWLLYHSVAVVTSTDEALKYLYDFYEIKEKHLPPAQDHL